MVELKKYQQKFYDHWNDFCLNSQFGNFLHSKKFLNYHKNKFKDESLLFFHNNELVAILPAASLQNNSKIVISHPGATYGGLIEKNKSDLTFTLDIFILIKNYYKNFGYKKFLYKKTPYIYQKQPYDYDLNVIFKLNGLKISSNISSTINLKNSYKFSNRKIRSLKKLSNLDISISSDIKDLVLFYKILKNNLKSKFDVNPTHSFDELSYLIDNFKNSIKFFSLKIEFKILTGLIIFIFDNCWHVQYVASNQEGNKLGATNFLYDYVIHLAKSDGALFFDFGISTVNNGNDTNLGLLQYKNEFGGGTVEYTSYLIDL